MLNFISEILPENTIIFTYGLIVTNTSWLYLYFVINVLIRLSITYSTVKKLTTFNKGFFIITTQSSENGI